MPEVTSVSCSGPACHTTTRMGTKWTTDDAAWFCSPECRAQHEIDSHIPPVCAGCQRPIQQNDPDQNTRGQPICSAFPECLTP